VNVVITLFTTSSQLTREFRPWPWLSCAGEGMCDPNIVARSLQYESGKGDLPSPRGIRISPGICLWVELAQVLDVPGIWDVLAFGAL
jgi:hypothetical protein